MNKPKDTMFHTWLKAHGSVGDLGPGYPIDYYRAQHTKLSKLLIKLGVSSLWISDFDRFLAAKRHLLLVALTGGISFIAAGASYLQSLHGIIPYLLVIMLVSGAIFMASVTRLIWR